MQRAAYSRYSGSILDVPTISSMSCGNEVKQMRRVVYNCANCTVDGG